MASVIAGLGKALPETAIQTDLYIAHAKRFSCTTTKQERVLEELYRRTEIKTRCSVVASGSYGTVGDRIFLPPVGEEDRGPTTAARMTCYSNEAGALALEASRRALESACMRADEVTHLITVSCTGFYAPGFDCELINRLPLPRNTQRTHVGFMGCHGAMNGLRVALAFAESQPSAVILLCAVELCSLHFQYGWHADRLVANSLFSDGAAAMVLKSECAPGSDRSEPEREARHGAGVTRLGRHIASGSFVIEDTAEAMQWGIGNHGFEMHLSSQVPNIVGSRLPGWLANWLAEHQLSISDINGWAVHPGGPRVLDAVEDCLSLHADALATSRAVLADCGNMSSPTVLFIVERLSKAGTTGPCVILGFGPGLTMEAALLMLE